MWKYALSLWVFGMYALEPVEAILTDIEGTTTSISFVYDVLFPYAKKNVHDYLLKHSTEPAVEEIIKEVAQIAEVPKEDLSLISQTLLTWMEQDKKTTQLKTLQGMMWESGYNQGDFQGHIYEDAFLELKRWKDQGFALYVYSSGSVTAQKLLFSHSIYGDLTPLFSGYFDTKIGGKKERASYLKIAEELNLTPEKILFLSDMVEELDAAREAGMQTYLISREKTVTSANCLHPSASNFLQLFSE